MDWKLPEDQVQFVLAPWRFSLQSNGFEKRLLTALELYESFPLDITITGGTKEANAKLAFAICGLKDEQELEDEEETDDEEEEEETDEDEQSDEESVDDWSKARQTDKPHVRIMEFMDDDSEEEDSDSAPILYHPRIPNLRIWTVQGSSAPSQHNYDVLIVLTTELHQEDHMRIVMEQSEKNKPFYLVRAEQETDLVREKLVGPCKTCAWERMRARTLEFQKKHKEVFESAEDAGDQQNSSTPVPVAQIVKLWEPEEISEVLLDASLELRKKSFSQFLLDITTELKGSKTLHGTGPLARTSLKRNKISQKDLEQISSTFQSWDIKDHPSKFLSTLTALDYFRLDVGLLGETGCGSSSLFNSLLGLKKEDKSAAPTGVTETTNEPISHPYPEYHNVLLWDLPGLDRVGSLGNQTSHSMVNLASPLPSNLPICDVYILVSPLRLRQRYIQLLQNLLSQKKICYVVLSQADVIEESSTEEVRRWSEEVLEKLGFKQEVFLVSAWHPETLDFPKLKETLKNALQSHKRFALANYVAKLVEEDVFWKRADVCKAM